MKVIIIKTTPGIGEKDDVKEVADGYARNFLLPNGIAKLATATDLKVLEQQQQRTVMSEERELKKYQNLATKLDGLELNIEQKASPEGKLYAQVSTATIAAELSKKGHKVEKQWLKSKAPVKELGEHEITVGFPHGLEAKIKLIINSK